jgi:hypothetical protein
MTNCFKSFLFIFIAVSIGSTSASAQGQKTSLAAVSFMSGCWEMRSNGGKTVINEQWMAPSGDGMLGMNRTLKDGKMSAFEFLRIVEKSGTLYYVAQPSENQSAISFELKTITDKSVVFENLAHDFPQTITYSIVGPDSMTAVVAGKVSSRPKIEFPMKRTKCS